MTKRTWLSRLFADEGSDAPASAPLRIPASPPRTVDDGAALSDLSALAEQLAGLIEQAKGRLDGAAQLVERSADDAADYGRALEADVAVIARAPLPVAAVESLLGLTRTMIERTQACETRLRAAKSELRTLQRDLDEAQETAERDPLTGLLNRRGIEYALRHAIDTAEATDSALSVAFCDIDAFDRLNEIHGNQVGDRILRLVADNLADGAGENGIVGRYGREEFVLLFEGACSIEAAARVDAVRGALAGRTLRSRADGMPIGTVTFSAGVASHLAFETSVDLIGRADQAMHRARRNGGNEVVIDAGE
ncbi:diguanylate cyclase domain-containing protein [Sphingomonas nostoxanthinifaciens]|uniref:diguanylate cyclase domain-containing protein n=1 Tax=Sphingomonas nostoxanthinifaciens TaxID=2872652 RepID=UPI001CC1F571|nr:diguanylate cyclase [Sphingomonas nostoxanthinifaciens]UAK26023.1 diguanylate cyclase [Sphingomonas nostoxanthinifaciens]